MEVQSPPKRMTRARAAAKASDSTTTTTTTTKSAKATAAPAKATTTRTASSMKRKTRSDDTDYDEESQKNAQASESASESSDTMKKAPKTRGRTKKTPDPKPEVESAAADLVEETSTAASTTTATKPRGRPKKTTTTVKVEPGRATRARATRKAQPTQDNADARPEPEPAKKMTRTRVTSIAKKCGVICTSATTNPTPGLKSAVSRPASRLAAVKKSVTFEEPEKENIAPTTASKAKGKTTETRIATGLRAKPVRKAAAGNKPTRASARSTATADKKEKPQPLSPKKDGPNRPLSRQSDSDDELAIMEKTPIRPKPMMKSPVKPPSSMKKPDIALAAKQEEPAEEGGDDVEESEKTSEPADSNVFGSPARRAPVSPWKDTLKSPAKRAPGIPFLGLSSVSKDDEGSQLSFKSSLLQSPAKRVHIPFQGLEAPSNGQPVQTRSPMKMSLFSSPAKRPMSPMKRARSPARFLEDHVEEASDPESTSAGDTAEEQVVTEQQHDTMISAEEPEIIEAINNEVVMTEVNEDVNEDVGDEEVDLESPTQLEFPGRLSAVLPRSANPALRPSNSASPSKAVSDAKEPIVSQTEAVAPATDVAEDPMDVDEVEGVKVNAHSLEITPPGTANRPENPFFGLRNKDLVPCDNYESEDELASTGKGPAKFQDDTTLSFNNAVPVTPTRKSPSGGLPTSAIRAANRAIRSVSRGSKIGFTPLARQLGEWKAGSPLKTGSAELNTVQLDQAEMSLVETGLSPTKVSFFEDEMRIRDDMEEDEAAMIAAMEADIAAHYEDPEFDDIDVINEDVQLAAEANGMSLVEPEKVDDTMDDQGHDDSISNASQEYGDENAVPIDPALLGGNTRRTLQSMTAVPPVTPMRPSADRTFNTTTKVPLKPADNSTPRSMKRRSASVSKVPVKRPTTGLSRNATVISYSPTENSSKERDVEQHAAEEDENPPVTPAKSNIESSVGTPARTPRQDLSPALLRGAVVFVDVHTSEGADASTLFVDLLTQMGARCVKSWPWNPDNPANGESSASKIGITHVVYKDGGKRTMEKVRESGGVVQCVGVGWVLDCERENEWLDEAPYYIDTELVPRGGARRRKSMEPKALTNVNGTLVTPMKQTGGPARECQTVPNNRMSRRDSTVWMRTPSDLDEDEDMDAAGDNEWEPSLLTPVPKTPAPEQIAQFAMDVTPETPTGDYSGESEKEELLMRTAPPKNSKYANLGEGLLSPQKDQNVLMRLLAARRKSLQFAPKIASPLSKAWK